MKIILRQDFEKLGKIGDSVETSFTDYTGLDHHLKYATGVR